ncbi:hypothetical protein [Myroides marinus]|uniref:hypothetical protein n=1 Tax=Myroides marinus TaxID=703342 RepID=UPI00257853A6|nr:hypothetical protein [Myroides marinus]MDM1380747.1 hypothetical protein [Myroides marinus]MDM1387996.1 hypothetical protein [Myroides marinus]MDM1395208.1 hypothetical protein [Myroides marinus]
MAFDATHAFATYSRTYFDKEYYRENKSLLNKTLLVFLIGPIFIFSIYTFNKSIEQASMAFTIFNRFALCFAYYHLIRQHWGFIALYRKKNGENDNLSKKLDGLLLFFGTLFPFTSGQIDNIQATHIAETMSKSISSDHWIIMGNYLIVIGLSLIIASIIPQIKKLDLKLNIIGLIILSCALFINLFVFYGIAHVLKVISYIALIGFLLTSLIYIYISFVNKKITFRNYPKWLLLFSVIITYNIAFHISLPIFILYAAVTVFHNIQYHKIVHFHNVNKYKSTEFKKHGFAVILTQKILVFITLAVLFNLVSYVPRIASAQMSVLLPNYILSTLFWGVAFHHYVLDSIIWRIKKDQKLNTALNINN